jgi:hypothetical protein
MNDRWENRIAILEQSTGNSAARINLRVSFHHKDRILWLSKMEGDSCENLKLAEESTVSRQQVEKSLQS